VQGKEVEVNPNVWPAKNFTTGKRLFCGGCSVMWRDLISKMKEYVAVMWRVLSNVKGYLELKWKKYLQQCR